MSEPFDDLLSKACEEYLSDPANIVLPERTVELTADEIHQLAEKILLLPPDLHDILFFRYLFNFSPENTEVMLEVTDAKPKLYFAQGILSQAMGLGDAEIGVDSMTAACKLAMERYTAPPEALETPRYSAKFRSSLRKIKAAKPPRPRSSPHSFAQRAAMFALCVIVGGASIVSTNADLRGDFIYWVKESFEKFSIFKLQTSENSSIKEVPQLSINYMSEGFELYQEVDFQSIREYHYTNDSGDKIVIEISPKAIYFDSEDSEISSIMFKGTTGFSWSSDGITYLTWSENNISCYIFGNVSAEEIYKIAENISII